MKNLINKIYAYFLKNYKKIIGDLLFIIIFITFCYYPLPFVVYRPGGLINLNDRVTIDNGDSISGSYNMSYVTVARGTLPNLILASVINNWDIKKESDSLAYDEDYETNLKISQLDLQNSVDIAKLVAFKKAGYDVAIKNKQIVVKSIDKKSNTNLQILDKIEMINGINCEDIIDLRSYINSFEIGDKVIFSVIDENENVQERYAYIYEHENRKVVGITFFEKYDYTTPLEVSFTSKATESGSSGGLMLTLAMYDQLIKEDLTNGKTIVGTGTIDQYGNVGAIGGIKYKMLGVDGKADAFLVPQDNCDEAQVVYEKYDLNFKFTCVATIDEAISYLNSIK